ncbi:unnamed protein product [Strongylus vulgaris]|uniref:Uncharacterized protein n=1 Tax=Strongylus vulgaris TaxID=40348 RepID=A0A3P7JJQ7_STRVU|nr:unnamed protein product [Strongylus vulgaris]
MFYEVILGDEGPAVVPHDFGVMEAWHILLWHIEQPTALQLLPSAHTGSISIDTAQVTAVVFLPTGRHLVSGGEDGVVACYRIPQAGMMSPGNTEQEDETNMSTYTVLSEVGSLCT